MLIVGTISPRKNIIRMIQAFERLNQQEVSLVIAGGINNTSKDVIEYIKRSPLRDRIIVTGFLEERELSWCYRNASILLFCSLYEGFGLPPLEAMRLNTPVIASNITSVPEVVGDAAYLVDPYNVDQIKQGMYDLLNDSALRESLTKKGQKQYRKFTWENTAKETLQAFEEVLSHRRSK